MWRAPTGVMWSLMNNAEDYIFGFQHQRSRSLTGQKNAVDIPKGIEIEMSNWFHLALATHDHVLGFIG